MTRKYLKIIFVCIGFTLFHLSLSAQISIVTKKHSPFSFSPEMMLDMVIINSGPEVNIAIQSNLYNAAGELMITIASREFVLPQGSLDCSADNIHIANENFSNSEQAEYIRIHHLLPSGKYNICYEIISASEHSSEFSYCDELNSDFNSNLFLVSPFDEEVLENMYPVFVWQHSEPFDILNPGDFFRIVIVEKEEGQSSGAAITANVPVYIKDYLLSHQVPYSIDATQLQEGKQYAWEVEKVSQGSIVQKTESWSFKIKSKEELNDNKYVMLTKTLDAGYYLAINGKIFFRFDQEYNSNSFRCLILDSKGNSIKADAINEIAKNENGNYTRSGYNFYELDLNQYHLKRGYYIMQAINQKQEVLQLKFFIE